jgi:hypothetical protein
MGAIESVEPPKVIKSNAVNVVNGYLSDHEGALDRPGRFYL